MLPSCFKSLVMRTFITAKQIVAFLTLICLTSFYLTLSGQSPMISDIRDTAFLEGEIFAAINLNDYVTDPDNNKADLKWSFTQKTDLLVSIEDDTIANISTLQDWFGSDTITFTVTDPDFNTDSDTAVFNVLPVNDPPVVGNIPDASTDEGGSFAQIDLDEYVTDVDNTSEQLNWTIGNYAPLVVSIDPATHVANITTPDGDWNGMRNLTFTATDPGSLTGSDPAVYTVNAVNDVPVVIDIPDVTINEGETFSNISLNELVSDVEDSDNMITWSISGNDKLKIDINHTTQIASIAPPNHHWNGSEILTFTATDTEDAFDSDNATFTVTALAEAPVANDDILYTVNEGGALTIAAPGVLANDTDGDSDPLTAIWVSNPLYSTSFMLNSNGSFTYVNNGGENIQDSFTYKAFDGTSQSNTATVIITITAVNDAPDLNDFSGSTVNFLEDNGAVQIIPGILVTDPDNTNLASATVSITSGLKTEEDVLSFVASAGITGSYNAATGILSLSGSATTAAYQTVLRTVRYNNISQNPTTTNRTIQTAVFDGNLTSNILSKTLAVAGQNDPPVVDDIPDQTILEGSSFTTIALDDFVLDPDHADNQIAWSFFGQSQLGVTISAGRVASITKPNIDWFGTETITFAATDPMGGYASNPAVFTVTNVNDAPVLSGIESTDLNYYEGDGAVPITNTLTVNDIDHTMLASARVWVSSNYQSDQDVLSCSNTNGLTGSWNSVSGEFILSGSATLGNYQDVPIPVL
jgi:VCBS repeat-containing protein